MAKRNHKLRIPPRSTVTVWPEDKAVELRVMAAMALQGILSNTTWGFEGTASEHIESAVFYAKALQAELDKEEQP